MIGTAVFESAAKFREPTIIDAYNEAPLREAFDHLSPALNSGASVLDLGCGTGPFTQALADAGCRAVGIDVCERRIATARARKSSRQATYVVGDIENLPFADAQFDAIISVSVLQYVNWRKTIRECQRVLKPGGRAAFVENLRNNPLARAYRVVRRAVWPYGEHLTPRSHIEWNERRAFEEVFGNVRFHAHNLLTPALVVMSAFRERRPTAFSPVGRACFDRVRNMDQHLIRSVPSLAQAAWLVTIACCNEPSSSRVEAGPGAALGLDLAQQAFGGREGMRGVS